MVRTIVIALVNANPDTPATLGPPLFQAAVAAAMDFEVEVYFAGPAAQLLKRGVAETLYPSRHREKSIYRFMQDAHEAGVKFYVCAAALAEYAIDDSTAVPELDGARGGAAFIGRASEDGVVVLTY